MRKLRWIVPLVLAIIVLPALYISGGLQNAETRAEYLVDVTNPGSGEITVTITITPSAAPWMHLFLRDPMQDGIERIADLQITRDGAPLTYWTTLPGIRDAQTVWTGFSREPIHLTYRAVALWKKGENSPRSYLDADFGYLRGMVVLYTPLSGEDLRYLLNNADSHGDVTGKATLNFLLPVGWTVASPWGSDETEMPTAELRNVYFGVGPFISQSIPGDPCTLQLNTYTGLGDEENQRLQALLPKLFLALKESTGIPLNSYAPNCALTLLPSEPIHGGAAGTNSLVVENDDKVIAHELFHWWNGGTIETSTEANWIKEGFTEYYAGKGLYRAGIWSEDEFLEYGDKFYYKAGADRSTTPFSLIEASQKLKSEGGETNYNRVYYGGAWIARRLDNRLQEQGKSLDNLWPALKERNTVITPEIFYEELKKLGGNELVQECKEYVEGRKALTP